MSGSTIGGIAGGVIGAFFGQPQLGYAIGSLVGGAIDPDVIKGPSLGDMPVQTSQEGVPRPIVFGSPPPFPGNIIQITEKVFTTKRERQGKGGPIVESQEVYQAYIIRICQGPATVITVWRDGKVVFDRSGKFPIDADGQAFISRVRFYEGDEEQLPDAGFEAFVGAGNQPAYRGTACMAVYMDNLTKTGGRIPNYEFRMASSAEVTDSCEEEDGLLWWYPLDDAGPSKAAREVVSGGAANGLYSSDHVSGGPALSIYGTGSANFYEFGGYMQAEFDAGIIGNISGLDAWTVSVWCRPTEEIAGTGLKWAASAAGAGGDPLSQVAARLALDLAGIQDEDPDEMRPDLTVSWGPAQFTSASAFNIVDANTNVFMVGTWEADSPGSTYGTGRLYVNRSMVAQNLVMRRPGPNNRSMLIGAAPPFFSQSQFIGYVADWKGYNYAMTPQQVAERYLSTDGDFWEIPDAPGNYVDADGLIHNFCTSSADIGVTTLAEVELEIARMAGVAATQFNVTADTAVEVDGFVIGKQMPAADALSVLGRAYFRDYPEYDLQIVSTPRGLPSVAALTEEDCFDTNTDDEVRAQPIDLPRKINVYFYDADAGAIVPVPATRTSINVTAEGIIPMQLPMTLNRDHAKQIAEITMKTMWEEQTGSKLIRDFPVYEHAYLTPADAIDFEGKRWRIVRTTASEGSLQIEAVRDRISNYQSNAVANILEPPQTPVINVKGPSVFVAMNLPALRAEDAGRSGVYGAVTGLTTGWPGADIYVTLDPDANNWIRTERMLAAATMGRLDSDVDPAADSNGYLLNSFAVKLYNGADMESITPAQALAQANGFAINTGGVSDVGQVETVVEDSGGIFNMTDVKLGQLLSVAAEHFVGDTFVKLDTALYFIELLPEWAGQVVYFKPVTIGTPLENAPVFSLLFDPAIQIIDGGEVT